MGQRLNKPDDFDPEADLRRLIERTCQSVSSGPGSFVKQLVLNSDDAGATEISIHIEGARDQYVFVLVDNGCGMTSPERFRFLCMAKEATEQAAPEAEKHGWQNLGVKSIIPNFEWCEVTTINDREGRDCVHTLRFRCDDLLDHLAKVRTCSFRPIQSKGDATAIGLPASSTGTRIRLWGSRGRRYRDHDLIKNLGNWVPTWVSGKVRVNSKTVAKREVVGEEICLDSHHPVLGAIKTRLYLPVKKQVDEEFVIGAGKEHLLTWRTLWRNLPERHQDKRPLHILQDPTICGGIYVPAFNRFRDVGGTVNDGEFFESIEFDEFIAWLLKADGVVDKVHEQLGAIEESNTHKQDQRLASEVMERLSVLGGRRQGPTKKLIVVSPPSADLMPGESVVFQVIEHHPDIVEFDWKLSSPEAGKLEVLEPLGNRVRLTAGKRVGEFTLVCFNVEKETDAVEIPITIQTERRPYISPQRPTVRPGETVTLEIKNFEGTSSGRFEWEVDEDDIGGRFVSAKGKPVKAMRGLSATYQAPTEIRDDLPGERYTVTATNLDNRNLVLQATVYVTAQTSKKGSGGSGGGGIGYEIDGVSYQVRIVSRAEKSGFSFLATEGKQRMVFVNKNDPGYRWAKSDGGSSALIQMIIDQCLLHHLECTKSDKTVSVGWIIREVSNLKTRMAERLSQRTPNPVSP